MKRLPNAGNPPIRASGTRRYFPMSTAHSWQMASVRSGNMGKSISISPPVCCTVSGPPSWTPRAESLCTSDFPSPSLCRPGSFADIRFPFSFESLQDSCAPDRMPKGGTPCGLRASTVNPQTFMHGGAARYMGVYCKIPASCLRKTRSAKNLLHHSSIYSL